MSNDPEFSMISASAPSMPRHRITVLLVDDQEMIGEAVRRMLLTEKDIDFHFCDDPTEAIRMADRISPTVILQDLVMPEMDGMRLVRYFRAHPGTREVPLIVLSGEENPAVKAEAFRLGANDYLVKLPDRLEVIARIRYHSRGYINLLERNEAYRALEESRRQLERRNQFIKKTFGRYLSDDVVESILERPEGTRLGGEKRRVTILMTDLRGFSNLSENLPPESVVSVVNNYLTEMTEIILKYQGTIDEFIGDAILTIFGAPILREDDARRACACAVEMQLGMKRVNEWNRDHGFPVVSQGIGMNTGEIVVGNIGSEKRTKYGVVGRNVNLAGRIESYTVGGQILISRSTVEACGQELRLDDSIQVMPKGFKEAITIYELGGVGDPHGLFLPEKQPPDFRELCPPQPVTCSPLDDKRVKRKGFDGWIICLAGETARLRTAAALERMMNIRLRLIGAKGISPEEDLYAKVTHAEGKTGEMPYNGTDDADESTDGPSDYIIRFTSIPPEAAAFFTEKK